jgi:hypothetical protein
VVEEVLLADFTVEVLLACFFDAAFLPVLFVVVVVLVVLVAAGFEAAGAVCAKRDTPARAIVMPIPIIALIEVFIFLFSFGKLVLCSLLS